MRTERCGHSPGLPWDPQAAGNKEGPSPGASRSCGLADTCVPFMDFGPQNRERSICCSELSGLWPSVQQSGDAGVQFHPPLPAGHSPCVGSFVQSVPSPARPPQTRLSPVAPVCNPGKYGCDPKDLEPGALRGFPDATHMQSWQQSPIPGSLPTSHLNTRRQHASPSPACTTWASRTSCRASFSNLARSRRIVAPALPLATIFFSLICTGPCAHRLGHPHTCSHRKS